ncbi:MAG TPA: ribosomal protein L7/L12 [Kofleriaceae bacterium]|nr:ribosomal protein L7/L12 [Kofleriaceae bacterium]
MERLSRSHADILTSKLARVPRMAGTSMRGGVLALVMNLRKRARTEGERESLFRIVASLGKLKGAAMKMGQHLSYCDPSLPDDVCATLAALQTHSPAMSVSRVTKILHKDLGAAAAPLISSLEPTPIGAASIGQVHRARLADGTRVAVKVQYPDMPSALKADFGPAAIAGRFAAWVYPAVDVDSYLSEAKARVLDECDYRAEARHHAALASHYADHDTITIPAIHAEYCGGRVLTTTFVDGKHLDTWLATNPPQTERDAIGLALIDFYVGSALRWNILPGDPHPGNYVIVAGRRLAIFDHGCTRSFAAARARPVLEAPDLQTALRAAGDVGPEAYLLLRVRFGVAAVLAHLGVRATWHELVTQIMTPKRFEVVLLAPGDRMIEIMREVRDLTGGNIADAKLLVEQTPRVLKTTLDRREAEALKRRLETSGGVVEIRAS